MCIVLVLAAFASAPAFARAQSLPPPPSGGPPPDPAETAKIKLGPLFMQPSFGFKNVGLDNNVFNEPADPKRDWAATLSLGTVAGLRYRASRLTVNTSTDYLYFAKYKSERSIDSNTRLQFEVRTPRIRPWIGMDRVKSHERLGLEIDARAGREMPSYDAGVEYKVGFRLGTRLIARQRKVDYLDEEEFRGVVLKNTLNAKYQEGAVQLLYELSPLSSMRTSIEFSRSNFETATRRDAKDFSVLLGIEGKQDAFIEGYIDVGWKERTPIDETAPAYSGLIARAAASFILWEQLRIAFAVDRDVPYSYEEFYTFYVQEGGASTVTWRPHQRLDLFVQGRGYYARYEQGLDERALLRTDKVYSYGAGFGFFIKGYPGTRVGLTAERAVRDSILADRRYDTPRIFTNIGFSF